MLEPIYPKVFRKQYWLMEKRGMAVDKLLEIMNMIISEQPLPFVFIRVRTEGTLRGKFFSKMSNGMGNFTQKRQKKQA
jgi:mRNA-degrading endonuclease YafQ of YafQ-DinJ toxin-antitoxin module